MPLTPKEAVDAATSILNGPRVFEAGRIEAIRKALSTDTPTVELPDKAPPVMRRLAAKARTNYLPLVLDHYTSALRVDGYRSGDSDKGDAPPWRTWVANGLSSRQPGIYRSALSYGASYVVTLPGMIVGRRTGRDVSRAVIRGVSARQMTAVYDDPVNDDYPVMALWVDGPRIRLYDETSEYHIGVDHVAPRSGLVPYWYNQVPYSYKFLERRDHNLGVCPVVRFRGNKRLDDDDELGIIEPLIPIQQRLDETVFGMLVAQFHGAFRQRYVLGWIPEDEYQDLKASASQLWTFADTPQDVQVGELSETDLTRYLGSQDRAIRDLASKAMLPPQELGLDQAGNVSAEAVAMKLHGKDRHVDEMAESFGESWKQTLQLAAYAEGDEESATDDTATIHWQDTTARSMAQTVDALGKLTATLSVPPRALWPLIPNVTQSDVQAWERIADDTDPMVRLQRQLSEQVPSAGQ